MLSQEPAHVATALRDFDILPDDAFIGSHTLRALLGGVSEDTIERRIRAGVLPAPTKFPGGRMNHWRVGAIRELLKAAA